MLQSDATTSSNMGTPSSPSQPRRRTHPSSGRKVVTPSPPNDGRWSRFQYHRSFESHVLEISSKLNLYFTNLGLMPYREFFPPVNVSSRLVLTELRKGFSRRIWRNASLVPSDENLRPPIWNNTKSRIRIPESAIAVATTTDLKNILNPHSPLKGFLHCMCLVDTPEHNTSNSPIAVYTPLVGGWVAASTDEQYKDREIKGMFSWRRLPNKVQKEVQYAYLMRLLIDACWWQVTGGGGGADGLDEGDTRDTTSDGARFVSFLVEDLALFPVETLYILEEMGDSNATQHYDLHGQSFKHNLGKCPCSRFADHPDLAKTHILIPTNRLRNYLIEQHGGRKRTSANPVVKAVFSGQPSDAALFAVQAVREKICTNLAANHAAASSQSASQSARSHKRPSTEAHTDTPNAKRSRRLTDPPLVHNLFSHQQVQRTQDPTQLSAADVDEVDIDDDDVDGNVRKSISTSSDSVILIDDSNNPITAL